MDNNLPAIAEFVQANRKELAGYVRQKLVAAGAKPYLDALGKDGIESLDREAAGVLLDLACALLRRVQPGCDFQAEQVLAQLPEDVRQCIRLQRSEAYHSIIGRLPK